ncbi:SDR family oxidoreductase [Bradyrhizobium sp. AUGA SZCCT0176]|uniref:SDR family oxidoreductase n=1 Tax=Bradyrhizobium sp. AUGA SZCCT0176 TaxID=2807664 RepID=UPI001BA6202B|nr:SDR family oxidoreductase [Bradyrhizobium sp. AUGA SZCCT0176]MBR1225106.1 SDR family oxidoreductase [Bradyrhizobium sp. AUGA SZCCT0176]
MIDPTKVALVTGSRSRIGLAIAQLLAAHGWSIIVHTSTDEGEARRISMQLNDRPMPIWRSDLTQVDGALASFSNDILPAYPSVALVLNASIFQNESVNRVESAMLQRMMAIHFEASVLLMQAAATSRDSAGQAVVILDQNVENLHGDFVAYCLSKTAMYAAIPRIALLWSPYRVNAVAPGPTLPLDVPGHAAAFHKAVHRTPLRRPVAPADVAKAVLFLLEADAVTGQTIFVDSGQRLKQWREPFAVGVRGDGQA